MTQRLVDRFDTLLFDLDGVVYVGPDPVPHAADVLAAARAGGHRCVYVTNNANRSARTVADHLTRIGVPAQPADVVTSPQAAAALLPGLVPPGSAVLVIGGPGIDEALADAGYRPVHSRDEDPAAVVQGFSPDLSWRELATAAYAVADGLPWVATNLDRTIPTPDGIAPGNGTLVGVVASATGRWPDAVAGKPEPPLLRTAIARVGASAALMVGDRLDTDIAAGPRAGAATLLVLTGVTTLAELLGAAWDERPDHVGEDLRTLLEPYPALTVETTPEEIVARCGDVAARLATGTVTITGSGPAGQVSHVAAALCWAGADAGREVDLPQVLAELVEAVPALAGRAGNVSVARMEALDAR